MQSTVKKYLNHPTTIHHQVRSRGTITETTTNVMGYVAEQIVAVKDDTGTHLLSKTVVVYDPDTVIDEGDRVEVDGKTFKINFIRRPRFSHKSKPNHLEVILD